MDTTERQIIDELFGKLKQAESQSGPRDNGAEAHIREQVSRQPAAPYYMAQAIVIQEEALKAANARIEELEAQAAQRASGGFLGGLFGGGGRPAAVPARGGQAIDPRVAAYANPSAQRQGGGFLAGAMSTAMGVAGGMLLGNALASLFTADPAAADEPADDGGLDDEPIGMDEEF